MKAKYILVVAENINYIKLIISVIVFFLMIQLVSGSLGTYEQNTCVDIKTILNTTSVNISTINYPNSTIAVSTLDMTKTGKTFNYTFCLTSQLGVYVYDYFDAEGNVYVNEFEITPSGLSNNLGFYIIILLITIVILGLGFKVEDNYIILLGTIGLYFIGIYLITNGISGMRDLVITMPLSVVILGLAAYISIKSALDIINGE